MNDEKKVEPMVQLIRDTLAQGREVTITLRGKTSDDDAQLEEAENDD